MIDSNHQKTILIPIVSALTILVFFINLGLIWPNFQNSFFDELIPLLLNLLILVPAIIGLWKFSKQPAKKAVRIGFIIYGLLVFGGYLNVYFADDPLAAGLPMLVLVMPAAALFTIFLFYQLISDQLDRNK